MSQTVAVVLPLPVALALLVLLVVLLVLSAVALSLRKPVQVRFPASDERRGDGGRPDEGVGFRLGQLHIDGLAELSSPPRHVR